jgi:hypothetical protein
MERLTENPKKPRKTNLCEKCNFECFNKKDYNRHLLTIKHKGRMNTNENTHNTPNTDAYNCDCGKTYKHLSSLYKHKKTCSLNSNSIVITENQREQPSLMDIITQNKEIMDMLVLQNQEMVLQNKENRETVREQSIIIKEQNDTIQKLIPKIGSNNNVITSTTNNQFNIQSFLTEDCKDAMNFSEFIEKFKMSFKDLENQAESGYVKGITKLFIENLQGLGKHKRPIHCTDKKRKTLYIKENDEWEKEGSHDRLKKGIQEITRRTYQTLMKETGERAEEYSDMDSLFSQNCISIQRNLTPVAPRETSFEKVLSNVSDQTIISGTQSTIE